MGRWRKRAMREVRDQLDRYLNFPINQEISIGDFGTYHGWDCRFEWQGNLADHGIAVQLHGLQHEIAETYATAGAVDIQGQLGLGSGNPQVSVSFRRNTALAFRGNRIGFDKAQLLALSRDLNEAIRGGLQWNRDWVIITQLWRADGFTHLVSGAASAQVQIEATAPGAPSLFNFADATLGLNVVNQSAMSYCAVGATNILPYFGIHKLRQLKADEWALYRYGG